MTPLADFDNLRILPAEDIFYGFQFKPFTNPSCSMLSSHVGRGTPVRPLFIYFCFLRLTSLSSSSRRRWVTVAAVGLTCKAYLKSGLCSIFVRGAGSGVPYLLDALNSPERKHGQGTITGKNQRPISYHESHG